jgi:sugar/nucleoside kinase (ribokinase family)
MKDGIEVAGTIVVDTVKMIDAYPNEGTLCHIGEISQSVGGCVPNTAIGLRALGGIPVRAAGRVGGDAAGEFVTERMRGAGVDVSGIITSPNSPTSFTDVMTVAGTGARTFFNMRGANAEFCESDINVDSLDCRIFHIGYLMLMDKLDAPDAEYGTALAGLLHRIQQRGIKTSIDVVSDISAGFAAVVIPALKYCDYAILNELEAGFTAGIAPRDTSGRLIEKNIRAILERFAEYGVKKTVIHCPERGFCLDADGGYTGAASLKLPAGYIKGAVGAGDAFCAGMLYALYNGFSDSEALVTAAASAAANLSSPDSVSGARSYAETMRLAELYPPEGD